MTERLDGSSAWAAQRHRRSGHAICNLVMLTQNAEMTAIISQTPSATWGGLWQQTMNTVPPSHESKTHRATPADATGNLSKRQRKSLGTWETVLGMH
jgi:hypothetical protein